jgi:hypothetical protein
MEFNAGIFSFTGTRKSPLNIFRLHKLMLALSRNAIGAGAAEGVASGIFPIFIKA